jgi:hypothetical protein
MDLTTRGGYRVNFFIKFIAMISHDNYFSKFVARFVNWYNNRLLPFIRQFFLILNRFNEFKDFKTVMFRLLFESILPEFDHYQAMYMQQQFRSQGD